MQRQWIIGNFFLSPGMNDAGGDNNKLFVGHNIYFVKGNIGSPIAGGEAMTPGKNQEEEQVATAAQATAITKQPAVAPELKAINNNGMVVDKVSTKKARQGEEWMEVEEDMELVEDGTVIISKCNRANCGKSFAKLVNLRKHQWNHAGFKPYSCR